MNNYNLDFENVSDFLERTLGIVNPTVPEELRRQIRSLCSEIFDTRAESLRDEIKSVEEKILQIDGELASLSNSRDDFLKKNSLQERKNKLEKTLKDLTKGLETINIFEKKILDSAENDDVNSLLKTCLLLKGRKIQNIDAKYRLDDSEEEKLEKRRKQVEATSIYEIIRNIPDFESFAKQREELLSHIDCQHRIVIFSRNADLRRTERNSKLPHHKLMIEFFKSGPRNLPSRYAKVLENAGIYVYDFGTVSHYTFPDEQTGRYTQESGVRKSLLGVIKKDEFGELQRYAVLTEPFNNRVPPEFYRDVLFSDMVLRNAKNNEGYIGGPKEDPEDAKYGYKLGFDSIKLSDFLRAIYLEENRDVVSVVSNYVRDVRYPDGINVKITLDMMIQKMDKALNDLFQGTGEQSYSDGR